MAADSLLAVAAGASLICSKAESDALSRAYSAHAKRLKRINVCYAAGRNIARRYGDCASRHPASRIKEIATPGDASDRLSRRRGGT
jgi:hypothetical protein